MENRTTTSSPSDKPSAEKPPVSKPKTSSTQTRKEQAHHLTKVIAVWTFFWVVTTAIATFGPIFLWKSSPAGTWITLLAVLLNASVGLVMISANARLLKVQDELMQKVQLQAMAITLGLTLVAGISFSLLDSTNLIHQDAEISVLVVFMAITYMISLWVNMRRYR